MSPSDQLASLHTVLASLYPREEDIRRIAHQIGLAPERIDLSGTALGMWSQVVREAHKRQRVRKLIQVASSEYPEREDLAALSLEFEKISADDNISMTGRQMASDGLSIQVLVSLGAGVITIVVGILALKDYFGLGQGADSPTPTPTSQMADATVARSVTPSETSTLRPTGTPAPVSSDTPPPATYTLAPTVVATPTALGGARQIAFTSKRSGVDEIWIMNTDGTGLRQITTGGLGSNNASWSPDGTKILFQTGEQSPVEPLPGGIQVYDVRNRTIRSVHTSGVRPSWSPDGNWIAFVDEINDQTDIFLVLATGGGEPVNLTNDRFNDDYPAWSPDGNRIAFHSDRGGNRNIWTMNNRGRQRQQITFASTKDTAPAWSPDGKKLAYHTEPSGGDSDVYILTLSTGEVGPLEEDNTHPDWTPRWSPDGNWILTASRIGSSFDVYAVSSDGKVRENLTNNPTSWDWAASWSPK